MKKILILVSIFLCISVTSQAALLGKIAEINQSATASLALYYASNPEIINSTPNYEHISCFLIKPDLSEISYVVAASGQNQMATGYASDNISIGIPSTYVDQYGAYQLIVNASDCLKNIPYMFEVVSADRYEEVRDGLTDLIVASGSIIPASGMTKPIMSIGEIIGDYERNVWLEGLSSTSATPTVEIELIASDGAGLTLWATESTFTYSNYLAYDGLYKHRYKLEITNGYPDDWYIGMFRCEVENNWVATPFTFQKSATQVVDTTDLLTSTVFSAFVSNASQSFDALMSGHPNIFQMYTTIDTLDRATPGVSSADSRHATAGAIYGASVSYSNYFDDVVKSATWIYDYDETDETRSKNILLDGTSIEAKALVEDVTLTTAGGS